MWPTTWIRVDINSPTNPQADITMTFEDELGWQYMIGHVTTREDHRVQFAGTIATEVTKLANEVTEQPERPPTMDNSGPAQAMATRSMAKEMHPLGMKTSGIVEDVNGRITMG
jgi:hypothetical protein